jgi:ATP-dependent DNA ligase
MAGASAAGTDNALECVLAASCPFRARCSLRETSLARLLSRPVDSIFLAEYEEGDIGHVLFRVACNMGLEGIVSKRLDKAYGAGRCKHWLKIKNRAHPAYSRVMDQLATRG